MFRSKIRKLFFPLIIWMEKKIRLQQMTEIPWSFPGKAAINFRNETCGRPKTFILLESHPLTEHFLSNVIGEMFRTNELFVDSVDLAFVYLFSVRDT